MDIYKLQLRTIMDSIKVEGLTFTVVLSYIFVEYIRPQTLYPAIDVIPYGKVVIVFGLICYLLSMNKNKVHNFMDMLLLFFTVIVFMSSISALEPGVAFASVPDFIAWTLVYFLITRVVTNERRLFLLLLLFIVSSFKMAQFSFRGWIAGGFGYSTRGFGGGPGWFANSGEFGIQMCVFFPIAFYFYFSFYNIWSKWKRFLFALVPLSGLTGMVSSSNRGTLVGGAAVIFLIFLKSKYNFKGLIVLFIVSIILINMVPDQQKERFQSAGEDRTSISRLNNWKKGLDMAEKFPVFGVGFKNWQIADREFYNGTGLLSHNIFIECVSELGYLGLAAFCFLILGCFMCNSKSRQLLLHEPQKNIFLYNMAHAFDASLVGFLVSGFFVTVLYYPYFWINLSMTVALYTVTRLKHYD